MPAQKSAKPAKSNAKPAAKAVKQAPVETQKSAAKPAAKAAAKATTPSATKAKTVTASKSPAAEELKTAKAAASPEEPAKKKPGRPPKAAAGAPAAKATGAKRGRKPKAAVGDDVGDDADLSDIEADLEGEPEVAAAATTEKVKPLRMKLSKAKERALMKEFGLDETVLSEEDMAKRRSRLKTLIKLGKTRGYLTHGEISDHLPDKLVDAETLEVVVNMLNDMGAAVSAQMPDAETLLLTNTGQNAATE